MNLQANNTGSIDGSMRTGQEAIICRLNSTLVDEVVRTVTAKPEARIGFVGTTRVEVRKN